MDAIEHSQLAVEGHLSECKGPVVLAGSVELEKSTAWCDAAVFL